MISSSGLRLVARTAANRSSAFQGLIRPSAIARPVLVGSGMANLLVVRNKSTMGLDQQTAVNGNDVFVHKPLQALDMHAVLRIKQELMEVDKNFDGRLDADELKTLLRKHAGTFSDEEIVEMGELYYAAKAGGSVSFSNFIEAVDRVAAKSLAADAAGKSFEEEITGNEISPMGIRKDNLEYCNLGKPHAYTDEQLDITLTHVEPEKFVDKAAYHSCRAVRALFDVATGWRMDNIKVENTMNRVIYLETIAAVPGMVAAVVRHLRSLRRMKNDGGLLQMFLEEAQNERMHLLTFVQMKDPGHLFRAAVIAGQFGFGAAFSLAYLLSPAFCHRFVGYVEEEACQTYTKIIKAIEQAPEGSDMAAWRIEKPPKIAIAYWKLGENSTVLDLMKAIRADEAEHRDVNHIVSGMKDGETNPFYDPEYKVNLMLSKYVRDIMTRTEKN